MIGNRLFLAGVAVLCVLCLGLLVPQWLELGEIGRRIQRSESARREQEMIEPLDLQLSRLIRAPAGGLTAPVRAPLRSEELRDLPELFAAAARPFGLSVVLLRPNVETLSERGYRELGVSVTVGGTCSAFQKFLLELCRMPALKEMRQVTIRRRSAGALEMVVEVSLQVAGR